MIEDVCININPFSWCSFGTLEENVQTTSGALKAGMEMLRKASGSKSTQLHHENQATGKERTGSVKPQLVQAVEGKHQIKCYSRNPER